MAQEFNLDVYNAYQTAQDKAMYIISNIGIYDIDYDDFIENPEMTVDDLKSIYPDLVDYIKYLPQINFDMESSKGYFISPITGTALYEFVDESGMVRDFYGEWHVMDKYEMMASYFIDGIYKEINQLKEFQVNNAGGLVRYLGSDVEVHIPYGIRYLEFNCINNPKVTKVMGTPTLISIFGGAFNGCTELQELTKLSNLKEFDGSAIKDCKKLTEFELPESCELKDLPEWVNIKWVENK